MHHPLRRGRQPTSHDWHDLANRHGLIFSLGGRQSTLDNAALESWFASLKNEDIHPDGLISTELKPAPDSSTTSGTTTTTSCTPPWAKRSHAACATLVT
jgi:transposase InsO family protein